jgi:CheY-like chemotaxis protein/transcriptional regulator with XRE-family HTH domain
MKAFGKAVRYYRNKLGLSQEALADKAELDRSYMSQIERGIKNATLNSIWRISQAMGVTASSLITMTEDLEGSVAEARKATAALTGEGQAASFEAGGGSLTSTTLGGASAAPKLIGGEARLAGAPGRPIVLVVDDDEDICLAVESILQEAGFGTRRAHSGMEAMRILASEPVALVVSDVRMANGNGLELCDTMRRHFPRTPMFFITGYDDVTHEDAVRRGAQGLFSKPFDLSNFVTTIKTSLEQPTVN